MSSFKLEIQNNCILSLVKNNFNWNKNVLKLLKPLKVVSLKLSKNIFYQLIFFEVNFFFKIVFVWENILFPYLVKIFLPCE